ncbi:NAD-dependent epimerase/dehydratase family protein [Janibacter anophelis]|uniref:NAD-dependent epimerase/dehydratase family protein n=1 Tax=Janibacter anophelis TaxID=319054 RepID=UPI000DEFB218|nr:NAD-dependent epimerase/dehydratase family protein [Janibacter anophelis]
MKVLITGGAGFIGSNLCKNLVEHDSFDEVRVIDDLSGGTRESIAGLDVDFYEGSILDDDLLTKAATGVDAIVHLAALGSVPRSIKTPLATHEANATGTLRVLEAARPTNAHTILASSSSVYGANPTLPKVETLQLMPMSPYAVSKVATEQYAMAYAQCYDLPVLPFRFFNVFGPGQRPDHIYAAVIPIFVGAALRGETLPVNGDGQQSRDFTYVGTVVETITDALVRKVTSTPTNLAFGTRTTLTELIELLGGYFDSHLQITYQEPRPGDVRHSQADNALLREAFPDIAPVDLTVGLERTVAWMKDFYG